MCVPVYTISLKKKNKIIYLFIYFSGPREERKSLNALGVAKHFAWSPDTAKYWLCFLPPSQEWENKSKKWEFLGLVSQEWATNLFSSVPGLESSGSDGNLVARQENKDAQWDKPIPAWQTAFECSFSM